MCTMILLFDTRNSCTAPTSTRNVKNLMKSYPIKITSFLSEVLTAFKDHPCCLDVLYHFRQNSSTENAHPLQKRRGFCFNHFFASQPYRRDVVRAGGCVSTFSRRASAPFRTPRRAFRRFQAFSRRLRRNPRAYARTRARAYIFI